MQVPRLFEGRKGNILVAIIRDAWRNLVPLGQRVLADQRNAKEKLLQLYRAVLQAVMADGNRGTVLLMQSRHLGEVGRQIPQEGFITFIQLLDAIIQEGQQQGLFRPDLNAQAIRQHLIGCGENALMGLLRHRMLPSYPADYTLDDACRVFEAVIDGISVKKSQGKST
jgi:TetR/AcrR family fatty acid metabolism transcriptional regulator